VISSPKCASRLWLGKLIRALMQRTMENKSSVNHVNVQDYIFLNFRSRYNSSARFFHFELHRGLGLAETTHSYPHVSHKILRYSIHPVRRWETYKTNNELWESRICGIVSGKHYQEFHVVLWNTMNISQKLVDSKR